MAAASTYSIMTYVPRIAVRLPLVLPEPEGFVPDRIESWPRVEGRLEYVGGRLLYMPPCGKNQQRTAVDVVTELNLWRRAHPEFTVGTNEAGMVLGGEVRAADAAVWRAGEAAGPELARTAPILAVEICGDDETIDDLQSKAKWYLDHGVAIVWIVDPAARRVRVVTATRDHEVADVIPEEARLLPGLAPRVEDFFRQL